MCAVQLCAALCLAENTGELLMSGADLYAPPMNFISTSGAADRHSVVGLWALQSHSVTKE